MNLYQYLNQFHSLDQEAFGLLTSRFKTRKFKKGDFITIPGQIQRELYFVKSGIQMSFFETASSMNTIAFTYSPGMCAIPESFNGQKPSEYYLLCLSDSEFDYVVHVELMEIFDQSQEIERLFRKITETILGGMIRFGDRRLSRFRLKQYTKPFSNPGERNGALAFALSLLNDQAWFEALWNSKQTISEKPALFIWGMKDRIVKPHYLEKFISGFRNSTAEKLETCGHFPQEEESEKVTQFIAEFLQK